LVGRLDIRSKRALILCSLQLDTVPRSNDKGSVARSVIAVEPQRHHRRSHSRRHYHNRPTRTRETHQVGEGMQELEDGFLF
jgi:hypothetical protein